MRSATPGAGSRGSSSWYGPEPAISELTLRRSRWGTPMPEGAQTGCYVRAMSTARHRHPPPGRRRKSARRAEHPDAGVALLDRFHPAAQMHVFGSPGAAKQLLQRHPVQPVERRARGAPVPPVYRVGRDSVAVAAIAIDELNGLGRQLREARPGRGAATPEWCFLQGRWRHRPRAVPGPARRLRRRRHGAATVAPA